MFDLRKRRKVNDIAICGTNGSKFTGDIIISMFNLLNLTGDII
jgi:hypothetical protein